MNATDRSKTPKPSSSKRLHRRLTLDIPDGLHRRLKLHAVLTDRTIADVIRELLDEKLPRW
ncbi:hypothetical protein [Methylobacterium planeticum]|uniref:Chromosome partitioning protein ParB n=1 Tax=Methylobacterium planeticum TaxID=2615211 RepID=A0A6N6MJ30_9HYPH|nr:hypothetical protein [Methylobacterium planeticum]KAB1068823.1 hypothetical protein F6X51_26270 [Methylobacterium planeticum]